MWKRTYILIYDGKNNFYYINLLSNMLIEPKTYHQIRHTGWTTCVLAGFQSIDGWYGTTQFVSN